MSGRPRFAGDGRLRLPREIAVVGAGHGSWQKGDLLGEIGDDDYDPFERLASGLFLAEEFARADLSEPEKAVDWHARCGSVDVADEDGHFHDRLFIVRRQQTLVAWQLVSLAHLSDHLPGRGVTPDNMPRGWVERWVQPAFREGSDLLWAGGQTAYERDIRFPMMSSAEPTRDPPQGMTAEEHAAWWAEAHAAYQTIERERLPVLPQPERAEDIIFIEFNSPVGTGLSLVKGIGTGWWDLVELQRRLMDPYIRTVGEQQVETGWDNDRKDGEGGRLIAIQRRRWVSLLQPVYVQLFEALCRVTEGQRGAALCRECEQPFLTLDARRASFCTDRERYRYTQRQRRRRLAAAEPEP